MTVTAAPGDQATKTMPPARADRGYWQELVETTGTGWNRFWFSPADPLPLCLLRIGLGLLAALYFVSYTGDLLLWLGPDGMLPMENVEPLVKSAPDAPLHRFSILYGLESPASIYAAHWTFVAIALLFAAGFLTRLTGIVTAVGVLSYIHRVPLLSTAAEPVLSMLAVYLVLGPSGRYLSLDRLIFSRGERLTKAKPEQSLAANIALRLMQVHFAAIVAAMALAKLNSYAWWEGEAIWHMLAQTISRPLDLTSLRPNKFLLNAWTHAIVYFELLFPVLIWSRLARPLLIGTGIVLWMSLLLVTGMTLFSAAMVLGTLCYIPGESWRARGIDPR